MRQYSSKALVIYGCCARHTLNTVLKKSVAALRGLFSKKNRLSMPVLRAAGPNLSCHVPSGPRCLCHLVSSLHAALEHSYGHLGGVWTNNLMHGKREGAAQKPLITTRLCGLV